MEQPSSAFFLGDGLLTVISLLLIISLIILLERLHVRGMVSRQIARKLIHMAVGILVSSSPLFLRSNVPVIILSLVFIVTNAVLLKSSKIQVLSFSGRKSMGTVYFPVSTLLMAIFWWNNPVTFILATLTMTLADTAASFVGEHQLNPHHFTLWHDNKTFSGSLTMFLTSFIIIGLGTFGFTSIYAPEIHLSTIDILVIAFLVSFLVTLTEATSKEGSDNLSVPLLTALFYDLTMQHVTHQTWLVFVSWIVVSGILLWLAWRFKMLSKSGSMAGYLMGILIFGAAGRSWIVPIMIFFILASLLSRLTTRHNFLPRTANRDIIQVLANGIIPTLLAILHFYQPQLPLYLLYLATLSAANADTWATEIGSFSNSLPRLILTGKQVQPGTSGGVTLLGILGSFAGALAIATTGYIFTHHLGLGGIVILAGIVGSLVDSLLGSSLQALYHCPQCEHTIEVRYHCHRKAILKRGYPWMDNNVVNLINTLTGLLVALLLQ